MSLSFSALGYAVSDLILLESIPLGKALFYYATGSFVSSFFLASSMAFRGSYFYLFFRLSFLSLSTLAGLLPKSSSSPSDNPLVVLDLLICSLGWPYSRRAFSIKSSKLYLGAAISSCCESPVAN
jgi:hypothetical protein